MSSDIVVLDASALLALLKKEPGAERVAALLQTAAISAVNLAEVAAKLADYGMSQANIEAALGGLQLDIRTFDAPAALATAALRPATRRLGLSLGDRACLALTAKLGATAVTTDRAWTALGADGPAVEVIR